MSKQSYEKAKYISPYAEAFEIPEPLQVLARLSLDGDFEEYLQDGGEGTFDGGGVDVSRYASDN